MIRVSLLAGIGFGANVPGRQPSPMRRPMPFRSPFKRFVPPILAVALTSCSPGVSDTEISSAKNQAAAKKEELGKLEVESKALNAEVKKLTGFSGPEHEARMKKAEGLRQEKERLEGIKADVDARVAGFESKAKTHREAQASEKP